MLDKAAMYIGLLKRHYCLTTVLSHDIPKLQEKLAEKCCIYPSMIREMTAKQYHLHTPSRSHLQARPIDTVTSRLHTPRQPSVEITIAKDHPFTLQRPAHALFRTPSERIHASEHPCSRQTAILGSLDGIGNGNE